MDMESLDEILSEFSEGTYALVSGISIIITIIFFIYAVVPLYENHAFLVLLSFLALIVCFFAPIFFRLADITLVPDVVGWLLAGVSIALFGWIIFHAGYYIDTLSLQYIIPSGLFGFASSLPLTKGVLLPLFGTGDLETLETEEDFEETEEDEYEGQIHQDFELDNEAEQDENLDEKKYLEKENEPW